MAELGDEHVRSGKPIVYTSADSVFQIACHEDVVPIERLYEWCAAARAILSGRHAVGRVIARPFAGPSGAYERTPRRRDFSLAPTGTTYLDLLHTAGVPVIGVGKIGRDLRRPRRRRRRPHNQQHGWSRRLPAPLAVHVARPAVRQPGRLRPDVGTPQRRRRLCRRAARGRRGGARSARRPRSGRSRHLCADHGVDPTTPSTDHSREYSPLLAFGLSGGRYDGLFEDVGATAWRRLTGREPPLPGSAIP